ncbi:hypothetical protein FA95DRAFT_780982 [Auriscalpium vulgare]|uniref:Uncharacterized protein n=1 Tax=Auriscalpium vulgare TaxID=40419 RepID=A0ACB8RA36_9AGAM|nr:hypothetical protein FA95DRAFT_780982 [Auriscalpium vulgare]
MASQGAEMWPSRHTACAPQRPLQFTRWVPKRAAWPCARRVHHLRSPCAAPHVVLPPSAHIPCERSCRRRWPVHARAAPITEPPLSPVAPVDGTAHPPWRGAARDAPPSSLMRRVQDVRRSCYARRRPETCCVGPAVSRLFSPSSLQACGTILIRPGTARPEPHRATRRRFALFRQTVRLVQYVRRARCRSGQVACR